MYHPPSHLSPKAFLHTLKWWKSSGCLWTSHQPFLQLMRFILWFNKRVDGGLRWYDYVYWGGRTPACRQAYLPPLFNIWVTGPGNPNNSSKLRATLSATLESQSNTITAWEVITVKVWLWFKSWIQNCSQHTVRFFATRIFARYQAYHVIYQLKISSMNLPSIR